MATEGQRALVRAAGKLEIAQVAIGHAIADIDIGGELGTARTKEIITSLRRIRIALGEIEQVVESGSR